MKRLVSLFILVPVGIIILALAVANRQPVAFSMPQVGDVTLYQFQIPLYVLLFASLLTGMVIGSLATWLKQGKHRKSAREHKVEATKMAFEAQKQKERADGIVDELTNEQRALVALGLPAPSKAA